MYASLLGTVILIGMYTLLVIATYCLDHYASIDCLLQSAKSCIPQFHAHSHPLCGGKDQVQQFKREPILGILALVGR